MENYLTKYLTLRMNVRGRKLGLEEFLNGVTEDQYSFQTVKDARANFEMLKELTDIIEKLDEDEK
jgi:hypothetical protein